MLERALRSGMAPVRSLSVKFNLRRLARVPRSGMVPVRPVLARYNSCKLVRVPRAVGRVPLTLVAETWLPPLSGLIFNAFTYVYVVGPGPRVMPSHSAIGFLRSQSSVALPCRVFLTSFRSVLQAATRLSGSTGAEPGIAKLFAQTEQELSAIAFVSEIIDIECRA